MPVFHPSDVDLSVGTPVLGYSRFLPPGEGPPPVSSDAGASGFREGLCGMTGSKGSAGLDGVCTRLTPRARSFKVFEVGLRHE